jgi:hypothetical protein
MWYPVTGLVEVAVLAKRTGTTTMPSEASRVHTALVTSSMLKHFAQGLVHTARHCTTLPSLRLRAEFGAFTERLST